MARWVRWREDEFIALMDFVDRVGYDPTPRDLTDFSETLKRGGSEWTPRAEEPSFRSPASIGSHVYRLRLLDEGDPRGEREAPRALLRAWRRHRDRPVPALVREPMTIFPPSDHASDRALIAEWANELETFLRRLVKNATDLLDQRRAEEFRSSWRYIEGSNPFGHLADRLESPSVERGLASNGLVGPPLKLKVNGLRRALQRVKKSLTWATVRPALHWANVTLGSLVNVVPGLESVKEFKEAWEAASEEAYEPVDEG